MNKAQQNIYYIVDDDDFYRKSLARLLMSAGYPVKTFPSAQSFLDSVPDVSEAGILILDLRMPGMDGFGLQERLNELASRLEIIFITADAQPGDREHALRAGAIAFLQKPFQEEILFEAIDSALSKLADENHKKKNNEQSEK